MSAVAHDPRVRKLGPLLRADTWQAAGGSTWIYFIQAGKKGPIKIGLSENPGQRLRAMRPNNPEPLRLIGVHPGPWYEEKMLQQRFEQHRIRGEWFHPALEILAWIVQFEPYCSKARRYFESKAGRP